MWIFIVVLFAFPIFSSLSGHEEDPSSFLAITDGDSSSNIAGCVSAITGDYLISESDFCFQGLEPVTIRRNYISSRSGEWGTGWHFVLPRATFYAGEPVNVKKGEFGVIYVSYHGIGLQFVPDERTKRLPDEEDDKEIYHFDKNTRFRIDPRSLDVGLTNYSNGQFSDHHQLFQVYAIFHANLKTFVVYFPDGKELHFEVLYNQPNFGTPRFTPFELYYRCVKERLENGNYIEYFCENDDYRKPQIKFNAIRTLDPTQQLVLSSVNYHYHKKNKKEKGEPEVTLIGSDGKQIHFKNWYAERRLSWALQDITGTERPDESYVYDQYTPKKHLKRTVITRRNLPDGRNLRIEYYTAGDHNVRGRHIYVDNSDCFLTLKVKRLYAQLGPHGEEVPIYEFLYHQGFTEVYDVVGNLTRYHYDKQLRLSKIETYEKENLLKTETFRWGSVSNHPAIYLFAKTITDSHGNPISVKLYDYDGYGCLIKERSYGNWTGYQNQPLQLDQHGNPKEGTGEVVEIHRTYTQDHRHLLESIKEGDLETRYTYLGHVARISSILQLDRGKIAKRKFFVYDQHLFLRSLVEDDGSKSELTDLTDVSQRIIEHHTPSMQGPYVGLPMRIEKCYLDIPSGKEKLLFAEERVYGQHAKILSKKIFDNENQFLYKIDYERDGKGNILSETNPLGEVSRYKYDGCLNKIYQRHFDGITETELLYDQAGRNTASILKTRHGSYAEQYKYNLQSKVQEKSDALNQRTEYFYDSFGRVIEERSPPVERFSGEISSDIQTWSYDILGSVKETNSPSKDTTKIISSTACKPLIVYHPNGAIERYFYDLRARLIQHIQADGTEISYEYDAFSRPLSKVTKSSSGDILAEETWAYSGFQLLYHVASSGVVTNYEYDGAGRKIAEWTNGSDLVKEYEYDSFDQITEGRVITPLHMQIFRKKYDFLGRLTWEASFTNETIVLEKFYTYDAHSNCIKTVLKKEDSTIESKKVYDDLNRLLQEQDGEGLITAYSYIEYNDDRFSGKLLKKIRWDPKGYQVIDFLDPKNRVMESITSDAYNRPLHREWKTYHPSGVVDKLHTQVFHGHDVHEEITTIYEIGSLGKALRETRSANFPEFRTQEYRYDLKGRLREHIKEDGTILTRCYNGLDQITSIKSSEEDLDYEFAYHPSGKIELAIDHIKKKRVHREFDDFGRLLSEQLDHGIGVIYTHDDLHGKSSLTLPSWGTIQYHYGDFHLEEIFIQKRNKKDPYSHRFLKYNLLAEPIYEKDIFGESIQKYYSPVGKLLEIHSLSGHHRVTSRNSALQITSQTRTSPSNTQTKTYEYDALSHLSKESSDSKDNAYTYSSIHQVIEKSGKKLLYNSLQELTQIGKNPVQHDAGGRLSSCKLEKQRCQLEYDSLDRLIKITSDNYYIEYEYDAFDRLISRVIQESAWMGLSSSTKHTLFVWDENKLIGLVDAASHTYEEVRVLRPSNLADWGTTIALEKNGSFYATHSDIQGNLWQLNHPSEHLEVSFSAYGEPESSPICSFGYLGKWSDPKTHLVYFGKRFFNPKTASFLTKDPKGFVDGINIYGFCKGDPLSYTDLYGLEAIDPSPAFLDRISEFFDRVFEGLGYACKKFGETFYRVNEDFNVVPILRTFGQAIGNYLQGETSPKPRERSHIIGERTDYTKPVTTSAVFTGGIKTTTIETEDCVIKIKEKVGGIEIEVYGSHNGTHGLLADIGEAAYQMCGGNVRATNVLIEKIREIIAASDKPLDEIKIVLIAHSQGGLTVANALKILSPDERSCLVIGTFGSASLFSRTTEKVVTHYVSNRDPIPFITNPVSYFNNKDVVHVEASKGKIFDHSFLNASYQTALDDFIKDNI